VVPTVFPNINRLLPIACTMPVTCPTIFTYHHDNGKTVRLGSDEHSQHNKPVNYDAVVQLFAERYPRSMLHVDPVCDGTQN